MSAAAIEALVAQGQFDRQIELVRELHHVDRLAVVESLLTDERVPRGKHDRVTDGCS